MSGVRAARSIEPEPRCPTEDVTAMLDQLYEILAAGIAPNPRAPLSAIESFLHEHARTAKSHEEFSAFFAKHGITPLPTALDVPEAGGFELSPVPQALESGAKPSLATVEREDPTSPQPLKLVVEESFEVPVVEHARLPRGLLWGAAVAAMGAVGLVIFLGYSGMQELRAELRDARRENVEQERIIDALQGQAAGIESNVVANGELIKQMSDKSDLVLQSLERADAPARKPRKKAR